MRSAAGIAPAALWGGLCLIGACAHPAGRSTTPSSPPAAWIDDALLGAPPREVKTLDRLHTGDLRARQVRLDRLLDLFDAARFGADQDARETLWSALGGHATGTGTAATREAAERLLQQTMALEQAAQAANDEPALGFCADAIMMLSTDLQTPGSAEDLVIRTLAYRTLAEQGHPRLADNARWRLYDHIRGTLAGAVEIGPEHRMEVAVQALYAAQESVEPLLADTAPHARPAWPDAEALWALLEAQREPLAGAPRWAPVLERRAADDHALHDTLRTVLPAARDLDWPLAALPTGTGRAESLAPVVRIHQGRMTIDAGRTHARTLGLDADIQELSGALGGALAQDGRGTLLLVADPMLPAPQLRTTLRVIRRGHAEKVEIAVREPRLAPDAGDVVVGLPFYVTHSASPRAGDRAWAEARVHIHLDGRGPRLAIDGQWIAERPVGPRALATLVGRVSRAYPRERGVRLTVSSDIQLQQLIDLLVAVEGGTDRAFAAVGWVADGAMPGEGEGGETRLARREALAWASPGVAIEQPYPLKERDQKRLEGFAEDLAVCLPELQAPRAPSRLAVSLSFTEGRLREVSLDGKRNKNAEGVKALVECVKEEGYALRLREHRETIAVRVTLRPRLGG